METPKNALDILDNANQVQVVQKYENKVMKMHYSTGMVNLNIKTQRVTLDSFEKSIEVQGCTFHGLNNKSTLAPSQKRRHTIKTK